jgi:hypothetical protein
MSKRNRSAEIAAVVNAETAPVVTPTPETTGTPHKSIRSLIMSEITAGTPTKEIAAKVQAQFPGTAAATKSVKHIAWYRSRMKKDAKAAADKAALLAKIDESAAS